MSGLERERGGSGYDWSSVPHPIGLELLGSLFQNLGKRSLRAFDWSPKAYPSFQANGYLMGRAPSEWSGRRTYETDSMGAWPHDSSIVTPLAAGGVARKGRSPLT